ncbi:hypothetical protein BV20DRAFT_240177 [Pilatotrama ljubarskyi]|nr:hypothetical protein BV20DRAFT_240177 [Pilatotrama ljubarskyi]
MELRTTHLTYSPGAVLAHTFAVATCEFLQVHMREHEHELDSESGRTQYDSWDSNSAAKPRGLAVNCSPHSVTVHPQVPSVYPCLRKLLCHECATRIREKSYKYHLAGLTADTGCTGSLFNFGAAYYPISARSCLRSWAAETRKTI